MNGERRKVLEKASREVSDIAAEIEVLAVQDQNLGEGDRATEEYIAEHNNRVKGWQGRLETVHTEVDSAKDDEEEAAENTRSEEAKQDKEQAVEYMTSALDDLEELYSCDPSVFAEMWAEKNEEVVSNLENASGM